MADGDAFRRFQDIRFDQRAQYGNRQGLPFRARRYFALYRDRRRDNHRGLLFVLSVLAVSDRQQSAHAHCHRRKLRRRGQHRQKQRRLGNSAFGRRDSGYQLYRHGRRDRVCDRNRVRTDDHALSERIARGGQQNRTRFRFGRVYQTLHFGVGRRRGVYHYQYRSIRSDGL